MEKLRFSITVHAPKKKVWDTMLDDATYRQWTEAFNPSGSYYEGEWKTGSRMLFLGPDENGAIGGMISKIEEARPYDFVSIRHLGEIKNGEESLWPEMKEAHENYTFTEKGGMTEVFVEMDSEEGWKEMLEEMWPKALEKLKMLVER